MQTTVQARTRTPHGVLGLGPTATACRQQFRSEFGICRHAKSIVRQKDMSKNDACAKFNGFCHPRGTVDVSHNSPACITSLHLVYHSNIFFYDGEQFLDLVNDSDFLKKYDHHSRLVICTLSHQEKICQYTNFACKSTANCP